MKINQWLWSIYAVTYDILLQTPLYQRLLKQVIKSLSLRASNILLDVGCGTGNLEYKINSRSHPLMRIEAIDTSMQMLDIAKSKNPDNVEFRFMDINQQLGYPDNTFDRVAAVHVLYALSNPENTLKELHRVLQPKGVLVIVNPIKNASVINVVKANLLYLAPFARIALVLKMSFVILLNLFITRAGKSGYYHFWDEYDWESVLGRIGFSPVSIEQTYGEQSLFIVANKKG